MPILVANELSKSYGERLLLDSVDLSVHEGERIGVVGNNGAGKSTLARVLAGLEPADGGKVTTRRGARVLYLEQEPEFNPEATAREIVRSGLAEWAAARDRHERASEALAAGEGSVDRWLEEQASAGADVERLGGWDRDHAVDAMLGHLGLLRPDDPVGQMSGGERRRVALAQILVAEPTLAILDEPTNHLDVDTIEWLEQYLVESFKGALLLVTHDRWVLDSVVQRTLEVDGGSVRSFEGGWGRYLEAKAERMAHEARSEANRQNFLRRELEWLRRSPKARSTKQKARVDRAEAARDMTTRREEQASRLALETTRTGGTIIDIEGFSLDVGGRRLIDDFSLHLTRGERIGIVGRNGTGKTSLFRTLLGELEPASGEVRVGANTRFAYFDQIRSGLRDDATVRENVAGDSERIDVGGQTMDVRTYLARFLFSPDRVRVKVGALSGGERARVCLAKLLLEPANVLLLDEPTNDLDVATLGALEEMIVETGATALIISHDRYFLDRVATSILAFEGEGRVVRYVGDYEMYRSLRAQNLTGGVKEGASEPNETAKTKGEGVAKSSNRDLSWKEKRELQGMMGTIETAETTLRELDEILSDSFTYQREPAEISDLVDRQVTAQREVERLMERWEELEARRDATT